jgi:hypothetical protein
MKLSHRPGLGGLGLELFNFRSGRQFEPAAAISHFRVYADFSSLPLFHSSGNMFMCMSSR